MALNPNDPNVAMLEVVAHRLGDALRQRLVFTGGAVVGLLITDPAMPSIRPTEDVDLVAQVLAVGDLISVIDGRDVFLNECMQAPDELRRYLAEEVRRLLSQRAFLDALPGHLPADAASQARLPDLAQLLRVLATL